VPVTMQSGAVDNQSMDHETPMRVDGNTHLCDIYRLMRHSLKKWHRDGVDSL
jgi:hypothetical protein